MAMVGSLPVVNLSQAKFECIYGRGCEGICCKNGRPGVYPEEVQRIQEHLPKLLAELTPSARQLVEEEGFLSGRRKQGLPMLRVLDGWCVFFNQGCVLHKVGAAEGDKYRYKPAACALFPLAKDEHDRWYVRQRGLNEEDWNLFCLDPESTSLSASETLKEEVALAMRYDDEERALREQGMTEVRAAIIVRQV
jgi:hypothetical protein